MSEKSQLDRIEEKIDSLIGAREEHHGRIIRLETQAGFIKASVAVLVSIGLAAFSWLLGKHNP